VSDLHCPATLLVTRHGDAEYGNPSVLSDDGGWLTSLGEQQVRDLAESLRGRNVARVFNSTMHRAQQSGELAAQLLGTDAVTVEGLQEYAVGTLAGRPHDDPELASIFKSWVHGDLERRIPGAESGAEVITRYRDALQSIADLHRGETVLVFTHGGVMSFVLPRINGTVRTDLAAAKYLPNCVPAEVAVDADGFDVRSWPGKTDRAVV
jgi:broad specificity phosphatase PhoE